MDSRGIQNLNFRSSKCNISNNCAVKYIIRNIAYIQHALYKLTTLVYYLCIQLRKNLGQYYLTVRTSQRLLWWYTCTESFEVNLSYLRETRRHIVQRNLARRSFLRNKFHNFIPLQAGYVSNRYWNFRLSGLQIPGTVHIFRKREVFIIPRFLLTYVSLQCRTKFRILYL